MATHGSTKELSVRHEVYIAQLYGGRRSASSGAAVTDQGDVYVPYENTLIECKVQCGELVGKPVRATLLRQFTKVAEEAAETLSEPAMALRFYAPDNFLANEEGWVDLTVRLTADDLYRSHVLRLRAM
jgi:hypothetical protein